MMHIFFESKNIGYYSDACYLLGLCPFINFFTRYKELLKVYMYICLSVGSMSLEKTVVTTVDGTIGKSHGNQSSQTVS